MGVIRPISLVVVALATMAVAVSRPASAASRVQYVPFRATLTEIGPAALCGSFLCVHVTGTGQATHLGAISEDASVLVDLSTTNPVTTCADEIRTSTLTAHNGDSITLRGPSVAGRNCQGLTPTWSDVWTVVGGTGRFAGATGSGTNTVSLNRPTDPNGTTTSVTTFTGTISY